MKPGADAGRLLRMTTISGECDVHVVHLVCTGAFAGVERYVANTAAGLSGRGIAVDVVGGEPVGMQAALEGTTARWHPGATVGEASASLRRLGMPDIVNSHMTQADLLAWLYRRRRSRVRHISTRHFAAPRGGSPLVRTLIGPLARSIRAELAISQFVAESIESQATVVHSGVATRPLSLTRSRTALLLQRLEAEKGGEVALRAWAASSARAGGWRLLVAGDGAERQQLEALVQDLGCDDTVTFLGYRSDVDALLADAGFMIAPTPREGLGIAVLEAMSHGTVVVASAGGGHLETVGAVAPELLFPVGDAEAAAAVIDRLVAEESERERLGSTLREYQRNHFTLDQQMAGTEALYERVMSR